MAAELGDLAGGLPADVNRDPDHGEKRADEDDRDEPRRNVTDAHAR